MANIYGVTVDHAIIKNWIEKHHGQTQIIDDETTANDTVGIRVDFPGASDDVFFADDKPPREINWEEFFKIFDDQQLAFSYNEDVFRINPSRSYKFLKRTEIDKEVQ
jgi:hypothetical protein